MQKENCKKIKAYKIINVVAIVTALLVAVLFVFTVFKRTEEPVSASADEVATVSETNYPYTATSYSNIIPFPFSDSFYTTMGNVAVRGTEFGNVFLNGTAASTFTKELVVDSDTSKYRYGTFYFHVSFGISVSPIVHVYTDSTTYTTYTSSTTGTDYITSFSLNGSTYSKIVFLLQFTKGVSYSNKTLNPTLNRGGTYPYETPQLVLRRLYDQGQESIDTDSIYQNGYESGFNDGQSAGYESGFNDGQSAEYQDGYTAGESAGLETGYQNGYEQGSSDGYTQGQTDGYNAGYTAGESVGLETGYQNGYEQGSSDGYTQGQTDGYNAGYTAGESAGLETGYQNGYSDSAEQSKYYPFFDVNLGVTALVEGYGVDVGESEFVRISYDHVNGNLMGGLNLRPYGAELETAVYALEDSREDFNYYDWTSSSVTIQFNGGLLITENFSFMGSGNSAPFHCPLQIRLFRSTGESEVVTLNWEYKVEFYYLDLSAYVGYTIDFILWSFGGVDDFDCDLRIASIGYGAGYTAGYALGVDHGTTSGRVEAKLEYEEKISIAFDNGYDRGYSEGMAKVEKFDFVYAISTVIGAPVQVVQDFLNFELLGVNMLSFVSGVITLLIIVKVIKFFI